MSFKYPNARRDETVQEEFFGTKVMLFIILDYVIMII